MRHRKTGSKLGRNSSHRDAMFRNMVTSLIKHDRITTTDAKAKALRGIADHLVTLAKRGDLHARRQAMAIVREKNVVHKLFETANARFGSVSGGYTRIVKVGYRPGDAAKMSIIELITPDTTVKKKPAKKKKAAKKSVTATPAPTAAQKETASDDVSAEAATSDAQDATPESSESATEPLEAAKPQANDIVEGGETSVVAEPVVDAENGDETKKM